MDRTKIGGVISWCNMCVVADHGILSGRGIPARRTRAMRTWVLSIVIGYTIICTKIAILALGD